MAKKKKLAKKPSKKERPDKDAPVSKQNQCLNCGDPIPDGDIYCPDCEEAPEEFDVFD